MARYCQANRTQEFGAITADNLVNLFLYDFGVLNQTMAYATNATTGNATTNEASATAGGAEANATAGATGAEANTSAGTGQEGANASSGASISLPGTGTR